MLYIALERSTDGGIPLNEILDCKSDECNENRYGHIFEISYVCIHKVFLCLDIHGKQNAYYCQAVNATSHYIDVIMGVIASQITSLKIVYSTV